MVWFLISGWRSLSSNLPTQERGAKCPRNQMKMGIYRTKGSLSDLCNGLSYIPISLRPTTMMRRMTSREFTSSRTDGSSWWRMRLNSQLFSHWLQTSPTCLQLLCIRERYIYRLNVPLSLMLTLQCLVPAAIKGTNSCISQLWLPVFWMYANRTDAQKSLNISCLKHGRQTGF